MNFCGAKIRYVKGYIAMAILMNILFFIFIVVLKIFPSLSSQFFIIDETEENVLSVTSTDHKLKTFLVKIERIKLGMMKLRSTGVFNPGNEITGNFLVERFKRYLLVNKECFKRYMTTEFTGKIIRVLNTYILHKQMHNKNGIVDAKIELFSIFMPVVDDFTKLIIRFLEGEIRSRILESPAFYKVVNPESKILSLDFVTLHFYKWLISTVIKIAKISRNRISRIFVDFILDVIDDFYTRNSLQSVVKTVVRIMELLDEKETSA